MVVPCSGDWMIGDVTITFSLVMGGFVWSAVCAKYLDAWGARPCGVIGAIVNAVNRLYILLMANYFADAGHACI